MSVFFLHHPTEADLALFAGGEAGPLARWRVERHLDRCGSCRDVVADFFHLQSDLGELAEVPQLDWNSFARQIKAAAAQAESPAEADAPERWFGRPAAWGVGLASATAVCGFVIFQQFSQDKSAVDTATFSSDFKDGAAATSAPFVEQEPASSQFEESPPRTASELAEGLSVAPAESTADTFKLVDAVSPAGVNRKNAGSPVDRLLFESDDEAERDALLDAEKVASRAIGKHRAVTDTRRNFARQNAPSSQKDRTKKEQAAAETFQDLEVRADKAPSAGNKRSSSEGAIDEDSQPKGRPQVVGGAFAPAVESRVEQTRELAEGETVRPARIVAAEELNAQQALTKSKSRKRRAEKTVSSENEPAFAKLPEPGPSAHDKPAAPPADRSGGDRQTLGLRAAIDTNEASEIFRGGSAELRPLIAQTETKGDVKNESSRRSRDAEITLLPAGLGYEEAEIGVAADGSMSIRTLDSATNTVTITHVYLP